MTINALTSQDDKDGEQGMRKVRVVGDRLGRGHIRDEDRETEVKILGRGEQAWLSDDTVVCVLRQSLTAVYPRGLYVTRGMIRVT